MSIFDQMKNTAAGHATPPDPAAHPARDAAPAPGQKGDPVPDGGPYGSCPLRLFGRPQHRHRDAQLAARAPSPQRP